MWSETLQELDGADLNHSDDFTRQDEIGALFYRGECFALSTFRWVDLTFPFNRDDSYFKVWPDEVIAQLTRDGQFVCIGSQITVLPDWRNERRGIPVKEMLLALAIQRFLESGADVMTGTMRNNRAMNSLSYTLGAQPLLKGATLHGVEVDLVAFYRRSLGRQPGLSPWVDQMITDLWRRRTEGEIHHEDRIARLPVSVGALG